MGKFDWQTFLTQYSKAALESGKFNTWFSAEVIASGWLGYPGATEDQLKRAETRIGKTLPPSYREFLAATNGWRNVGSFGTLDYFWSAPEIEWFSVRNREWIEAWMYGAGIDESYISPLTDEEYLVYGEEQYCYQFREEYLWTALEISRENVPNAIYLLNPEVVTAEGEWEAWWFESELGAYRYPSFWDLMQREYKRLLELINE